MSQLEHYVVYNGQRFDVPKPPELDHVVCCNPARALCGAHVMGQDVKLGGPEKAKNPCQECWNRAADGEKCGEPNCPGAEE